MSTDQTSRVTTTEAAPPERAGPPRLLVLVVAVLLGVGAGVFVLGRGDAAPVTTVSVPAAGNLATRIGQLERAVASDPKDLKSLQSLGSAYVSRASQTGDPAFYRLATTALDRATALDPGNTDTLLVRGSLQLSLHNFAAALDLGVRAQAQRAGNPSILGVLVDAHVELGQYDQAGAALQQMLDIRPNLPALARASYLRELSGDLTGAVTVMQQAVAAGTGTGYDTAQVGALLGDLLFQRGDVDGADQAYQVAARASPELVRAQIGLAQVKAARGDGAGAITDLEDLQARSPNVLTLTLLEQLQRRDGRTQAADETGQLLRALARLQEDAGYVVDLEMALFEADRPNPGPEALRYARGAFKARPDNVFVDDAFAWASFRTGDTASAVPLMDRALRNGLANPLVSYHAAEVYAAAGQLDKARERLLAVHAANPWFSFGHLRDAGALAKRLGLPVPTQWA